MKQGGVWVWGAVVLVIGLGGACGDDSTGPTGGSGGSAVGGSAVGGSAAGAGGAGGGSSLTEHVVKPSATDSSIGSPDRDEYAYLDPSATPRGELFLFLPGTTQQPSQTKLLLQEAARAGYHVIGVDYPNSAALSDLCGDDLDCYDLARQEIIAGADMSTVVSVTPENAILNRTVKLLDYLAAQFPTEGWDTFLSGAEPAWDLVAVAGHSQGGGHAAYLAKLHAVARVVLFSSVVDASSGAQPTPAVWLTTGHATSSDRYFGFAHTADPLAPRIEAGWGALELPGALTSVDDAASPFGDTHQLSTSTSSISAHNAVVLDGVTPMSGADPVYREVWHYMMTAN
ncbi:MAG: hypothetical protein U0271_27690 [Polyangiaceae bacterium]